MDRRRNSEERGEAAKFFSEHGDYDGSIVADPMTLIPNRGAVSNTGSEVKGAQRQCVVESGTAALERQARNLARSFTLEWRNRRGRYT